MAKSEKKKGTRIATPVCGLVRNDRVVFLRVRRLSGGGVRAPRPTEGLGAVQHRRLVAFLRRSYHLEQEKFQIVRFLHAPEDGVVAALLALLDLPQLHAGVPSGGAEHGHEPLRGGEMAARAGG